MMIVEAPALVPLCPHCDTEIREILAVELSVRDRGPFGWGKRYVYACPHCRHSLGISHRKGFWAG